MYESTKLSIYVYQTNCLRSSQSKLSWDSLSSNYLVRQPQHTPTFFSELSILYDTALYCTAQDCMHRRVMHLIIDLLSPLSSQLVSLFNFTPRTCLIPLISTINASLFPSSPFQMPLCLKASRALCSRHYWGSVRCQRAVLNTRRE